MANANVDQIINDVKSVLPIYDTDLYDRQLELFVKGAISKLKSEGVPNIFDPNDDVYGDYIACISYQVAMDMDLDIDIERLREQYVFDFIL